MWAFLVSGVCMRLSFAILWWVMAGLGIPSKDEDFIGRIARISRRVHAKQMEREVVRRYLFKAKFAVKRALKKMP